MFLTQSAIAANPRLLGHLQELTANRNIWNNLNRSMIEANRSAMSGEMLATNALAGFSGEFWKSIDAQIIRFRDIETGMEIVNDLLQVQTVLDIGKTVRAYNIVGDIAKDVSVSMDGQAPYSFDHTDYTNDGDPIPIFTAGYGVNWRLAAGLGTVGIDLVLDSQEAKLRHYYRSIVQAMLDGAPNIKVNNYPSQGLRTHRNTVKLNLGSGAGGASIDLTAADLEKLSEFFTTGAFWQVQRENAVDVYDVMWVSPEIWANLNKMSKAILSGGGSITTNQTVLQVLTPFIPVRNVRRTYALKGNEFIAYERRQDVVTPMVGLATGVVPLPRLMPQSNYNFQIMGAMGLQVKRDGQDKSGVLYGANLD